MADALLDRPPVIPAVPSELGSARATNVRFATAINKIMQGGIGANMGVTLAANATSSTFSDSRIGPYTQVGLQPASAHAVDILPSIWVETTKGSCTIHHALVPYTDLAFVAVLLG